jgi:conjugative transposon TraN protein
MKKIRAGLITGILYLLALSSLFSQDMNNTGASVMAPYPLCVGYDKTTNLIFPYTIISVDRGSKNILAQKAKNVENILQVKAGKKGFEETNLTVITADGKFYSFLLNYAENPSVLNLDFNTPKPSKQDAFFSPEVFNEKELREYSKAAAVEKKKIRGIKDKAFGICFRLNGLFIHDRVMYYRIKVENQSNIRYDIGQVRFFICDRQKAKRTAVQEIEITPLYVHNDTQTVKGQSEHVFVFALSKFTIPDKKYLSIQLMEKNGGRHLDLKVPGRAFVRSTVLPPL